MGAGPGKPGTPLSQARAARLALPGTDSGKARKQVEESDAQRRDYLQRFYDVRQESPSHYDLIVNTDMIMPDSAAALIATAARG